LRDNIQLDTVFDCLNLAYRVNDPDFKSSCLGFVAKNVEEVQKRAEWIQLTNSEPQIARDLCEHLYKRVRKLERAAIRPPVMPNLPPNEAFPPCQQPNNWRRNPSNDWRPIAHNFQSQNNNWRPRNEVQVHAEWSGNEQE
jgi:hypothetical protein